MTTLTSTFETGPSAQKRRKFRSWRIVVPVLVAAFNAVMCAGPGSLAAPATLRWFERLICPSGQRIAYDYVETAGSAASPLTQFIYCESAAGQRTLSGNRALSVMMGTYFALFLLPALAVGLTVQFGSGRRAPRPLASETERAVRLLVSAGRPAEAAKLLREKTGGTPRWAREVIDRMAHTPEPTPAPAAPPPPSALDKLKQLKEMLDTSLITSKDYEAKKADILSQL